MAKKGKNGKLFLMKKFKNIVMFLLAILPIFASASDFLPEPKGDSGKIAFCGIEAMRFLLTQPQR